MRNAAAQFDDDFANEEPARKARPRRPRDTGGRKRARPRKAKNRARYIRYAAVGLTALLAIGIVFNAVALQQSRHPAPLFAKAVTLVEETRSAPTPPPMPTPAPVRTASLAPDTTKPKPAEEATGSIAAMLGSPARVNPPKMALPVQRPHRAEAAPSSKAKGDDAIGKLLKTNVVASNDTARTGGKDGARDAAKDSTKTVLAAQRALMKLGFVVKPNGAYTASTRSAIEAFERDQNLPVKGELSRKVLKQLSAESGVAID